MGIRTIHTIAQCRGGGGGTGMMRLVPKNGYFFHDFLIPFLDIFRVEGGPCWSGK